MHRYQLEGEEYSGPIPEFAFKRPEQSRVFKLMVDPSKRASRLVLPDRRPLVAKVVGRMLQLAIADASEPEKQSDLTLWAEIRDSAARAANAIDQARKCISAIDQDAPRAVRRLRRRQGRGIQDLSQMRKIADRDLRTIEAASAILAELSLDAARKRAEFASENQNPGDPSRQAFVIWLMEGWIFLTGKRPGKSKNPGQTLFSQFAEAAWQDWHGECQPPDFSSQTNILLDEKFDEATVQLLIADGPVWVRSIPGMPALG